jgi:hypothetical protein
MVAGLADFVVKDSGSTVDAVTNAWRDDECNAHVILPNLWMI